MAHRINSKLLNSLDEAQIELFSKLSWDKLRPGNPWLVMQQDDNMVPIMHMHRKYVRAYIENNFDVDRTVRCVAKSRLSEMDDTGKEFHKQLAHVLKEMVRNFNKAK